MSNDGIYITGAKGGGLFNSAVGKTSIRIDSKGLTFRDVTNADKNLYEILGSFAPLIDNTSQESTFRPDQPRADINGIGYVVETRQTYGDPYGGDFFSLARSIGASPTYYNGFMYSTSGSIREIGSHFFDPIYMHPYGADNYIKDTWVSWSNWDNGEKYPALVQNGDYMGGIAFPKSGKVTLFDSNGNTFWPNTNNGGAYNHWQVPGNGTSYADAHNNPYTDNPNK